METDTEQELFFPAFLSFSSCFCWWEKVKAQMKARAPRSACFGESGSSLLTPIKSRDTELGTQKASVFIISRFEGKSDSCDRGLGQSIATKMSLKFFKNIFKYNKSLKENLHENSLGTYGPACACGGDESWLLPIVWGYLGLVFMLILLSEQHGARPCVLGSRQGREMP